MLLLASIALECIYVLVILTAKNNLLFYEIVNQVLIKLCGAVCPLFIQALWKFRRFWSMVMAGWRIKESLVRSIRQLGCRPPQPPRALPRI